MTHMLPLLPMLVCGGMLFAMFGAGAILWLATRTPVGRLSWFERRARRAHAEAENGSGGSRS